MPSFDVLLHSGPRRGQSLVHSGLFNFIFKKNLRFLIIQIDLQLQKGTKAPQAAGRIHTDFEKGFIMAEVFKFNDLKEEGTEAAVKVIFIFNVLFWI